MLTVEILSTGTEVVTGEIINTNTSWLADLCTSLGATVTRHVAVADDRALIAEAIREASTRARCVLVTGGLGPTCDDVTMAALADAADVPLVFDEAIWQQIELLFSRRGRQCPATNRQMAYRPDGSTALSNAVGTAPGARCQVGTATVMVFPGVPFELEAMAAEHLVPWCKARGAGARVHLRVLHSVGVPEAEIAQRLAALRWIDVSLGYRVHNGQVTVKLLTTLESPTAAEVALARAEAQVRGELGAAIYGCGKETLAGAVGALLLKHRATVAVAESCTGGALASALTDVPGASGYFLSGAVTYSNAAKIAQLGVPGRMLAVHGAVSADVVQAMAEGMRQAAQSTYAVAVTGIAGPGGGTPEKPVGTVYIAVATPDRCHVEHKLIEKPRLVFKQYVVTHALDLLRTVLK